MQAENPDQDGQTPDAQPPVAAGDHSEDAAAEARPSRRAAWLAMGVVTLALGLIWMAPGIGDSQRFDDPFGDGFEHPGDVEDAEATGRMAPLNFTLKDMDGVDVRLASFRGKVIVLNFWATWCAPCRVEIPDLIELQREYADDLVVLGFSVDDPVEKLKPYAAEMQINYPILVGNGREDVQDAFGPMWGIPVTVIIGRDGRIARKHTGIATKEQFEREIAPLL